MSECSRILGNHNAAEYSQEGVECAGTICNSGVAECAKTIGNHGAVECARNPETGECGRTSTTVMQQKVREN